MPSRPGTSRSGSRRDLPSLWIYKNNASGHDQQLSAGDWDEFFENKGDGTWGGTDTMGPRNRTILLEEMRRGDLVLAWQSDRRAAVGVLRFDGIVDSGQFQRIRLTPLRRFDVPVPILDLRRSVPDLAHVAAFQPGFPRTLYRTTAAEARLLLDVCGYRHTGRAQRLRGDENSDAVVDEAALAAAAGFGDPVTNRRVERAAVNAVTADYEDRGWQVQSVEADRCGYDLVCRKGRRTEHVEVKGVAGASAAFILTDGEKRKAESDESFFLYVVTNALASPKTQRLAGRKMLDKYALSPISWAAKPRAKISQRADTS